MLFYINKSATNDSTVGKEELDNESDLEEYHLKSSQQKLKRLNLNSNSSDNKNLMCTPKKRTISTLSDFGPSLGAQMSIKGQKSKMNNASVYYRLASCGQDNQICFWDLTSDVLREKSHPPQHSNSSRSQSKAITNQVNHSQLPQIIIQPMELLNKKNTTSDTQPQQQQLLPSHRHHHSTASSIVSTAKSLFTSSSSSSKHNSVSDDANNGNKNLTLYFHKICPKLLYRYLSISFNNIF